MDAHGLSFWLRWLHVVAMAAMVGGALVLLAVSFSPGGSAAEASRTVVLVAAPYEAVFWLAGGLLVMTGIGNLGALGAALPPPDSAWGGRLTLKLWLVLGLFLLSLVRSLVVVQARALPAETGQYVARGVWQGLYGATALLALVIVALAVGLAHA